MCDESAVEAGVSTLPFAVYQCDMLRRRFPKERVVECVTSIAVAPSATQESIQMWVSGTRHEQSLLGSNFSAAVAGQQGASLHCWHDAVFLPRRVWLVRCGSCSPTLRRSFRTALSQTPTSMDEQGQNDELYPIAVLIDELKVLGEWSLVYIALRLTEHCVHSMTMSFYA
ncbi:hypothetical protein MRB53_041015 [Persea americana]|nr:hypothetical protein MRB53_041015 [Persea americana]